ncbi:MAG: BON domain-containing protein [Desulfococcaceae bacterium]|jgi:osmotically-inducible protein OsmY|nr:BON domain-containing protein [Desulfococcaceae bacterium]
MNQNRFIRGLFTAIILLAFIAGCAGTPKQESAGEYVDNTVLTSRVKAEIFKEPMLKVFRIDVESFKGVVQLSGFVDSAKVSARAAEVAASVDGVKSVKNSLIVK